MIKKFNLDETELTANYEEFLKFVESKFTGERQQKLLEMYSSDFYAQSLCLSPASMCSHWHYAFPGGYIIHIMNVVKGSFGQKKLYEAMGLVVDWTDEQMVFAALHHDLGKLGDPDLGEYYVNQDNDWKAKQGEVYKMNPDMQYMEVTDRAVYILQKYGIKYDWKEQLSIKLADGMYNEGNEKYLKTFRSENSLRTNLPIIIHAADYMSCTCERNEWRELNK